MLTILWWVLGSIGALILLLFLWLGYRAFKFRRLQPIIFEYLSLQDVETALMYIDDHPRLLTSDAEDFITVLLDRTWARGDARMFVSSAIRLSLLVGCREYGLETARQMAAGSLQTWLDAAYSPSWQRALELLGQLVVEREFSIPEEEVDKDLVEAMSHIMELLRPLAANEEVIATQDEILRSLRQILRQKGEESQPLRGLHSLPIWHEPQRRKKK
ncbi:MAG: hypothetical protein ISS49_12000 [Anaerolineae bacterium]|nr:hypothetical protein [Anaerolineae bacterium]